MSTDLLIATNNQGKIAELRVLLRDTTFNLYSLSDFQQIDEVGETGMTFRENARLKASGYALQTQKMALSDDSGLEVAALGGRPGVLSARYGGEHSGFTDKMFLLLDEMGETGSADRSARFVCSMSVAAANGEILLSVDGTCEGTLASRPRGSAGFGYDPLFIPDGFDQTFGELDSPIKLAISHRSRAFRQIIPFLLHITSV